MVCSRSSLRWRSMGCRTTISKPIALRCAPLLPKNCWRRPENISTPPTCKSFWPATARKLNRKPPSSAKSNSSTPKATAFRRVQSEPPSIVALGTYKPHNAGAMAWRSSVLRILLSFCVIFALCATTTASKKKPPVKPININTATSEELQQVPGIGPATAQKILQMRKSYGPFKSVDDLLAIRGLGQKRLDKMRKYLTVGNMAASKTTPATANPATPVQKPPDKP